MRSHLSYAVFLEILFNSSKKLKKLVLLPVPAGVYLVKYSLDFRIAAI